MEIYCLTCGSKMPGTAKFCASCGAELYHLKQEVIPSNVLAPLIPETPSPAETANAMPQISSPDGSLDEGPKKQRPISALKKVTFAATSVYLVAVIAALTLHQRANAKAKIVRDVEEVQTQFVDLLSNRTKGSPTMLTLLKWPDGAADGSADGFISRTEELAPLLSNELAECKKVHERTVEVLSEVPPDNPNHSRASLLVQVTQEDVDLYESFLREVPLAEEARSKSPGMRAEFLNSRLWSLRDQQNENLKRRQATIERLR